MIDPNLKTLLRNRLTIRKNPEYLRFLAEKYKGRNKQRHHILGSVRGSIGRLNDLLIAMLGVQEHESRKTQMEPDFIEDFVQSLENLFDYIEYLQKRGQK